MDVLAARRGAGAAESEVNFAVRRIVVIAKPGGKVVGAFGEVTELDHTRGRRRQISAIRTGNDEGGVVGIKVQVPLPQASGEIHLAPQSGAQTRRSHRCDVPRSRAPFFAAI